MSKIAFVTDSTAYIPKELCKAHNISVMPQLLIWGDQTYRDEVDIQPNEFYARLKDGQGYAYYFTSSDAGHATNLSATH